MTMHHLQAFSLGLLALFSYVPASASDRTFTLEDNRFVKDGQPIRLLSGRLDQPQPTAVQPRACQPHSILQDERMPCMAAASTIRGSTQPTGQTACSGSRG